MMTMKRKKAEMISYVFPPIISIMNLSKQITAIVQLMLNKCPIRKNRK